MVNQREVGADTKGFNRALKSVLRQDPDIILVGEMRDTETMGTALTAAETGHLVFATLHTQDAPQTIDRIIDVFPPHQQQQIRVQLSTTLMGVCQQLLLRATGAAAAWPAKLLVPTPAVRLIARQDAQVTRPCRRHRFGMRPGHGAGRPGAPRHHHPRAGQNRSHAGQFDGCWASRPPRGRRHEAADSRRR